MPTVDDVERSRRAVIVALLACEGLTDSVIKRAAGLHARYAKLRTSKLVVLLEWEFLNPVAGYQKGLAESRAQFEACGEALNGLSLEATPIEIASKTASFMGALEAVHLKLSEDRRLADAEPWVTVNLAGVLDDNGLRKVLGDVDGTMGTLDDAVKAAYETSSAFIDELLGDVAAPRPAAF